MTAQELYMYMLMNTFHKRYLNFHYFCIADIVFYCNVDYWNTGEVSSDQNYKYLLLKFFSLAARGVDSTAARATLSAVHATSVPTAASTPATAVSADAATATS